MFNGFMFKNYKCFNSDEYVKLPDLKKVNVIIGKNNSGKSSIIDILSSICDGYNCRFGNPKCEILISYLLNEEVLKYSNLDVKKYSNETINLYFMSVQISNKCVDGRHLKIEPNTGNDFIHDNNRNNWGLVPQFYACKDIRTIRRITAERNIVAEAETFEESLSSTGEGASNLVRKFLINNELEERIIEEKLLNELNNIMSPDAFFDRINVQQIEKNGEKLYEIYLYDSKYGRVALSQSGSGLKTIILMLLNLLVIPETKEYNNKQIIYAFEELENNLHPALQRRVFNYLYKYAVEKDSMIFLTTHSHVAINIFGGKEDAQIYHVINNDGKTNLNVIKNTIEKIKLLEDLNVKASDILQCNGVIWVEGPSDRVYINHWLKVICDNKYEEGLHYQFLYYGGKLLSHYTTEDNELNELINILKTNRNAAIIIDSDKNSDSEEIRPTKKRIESEFNIISCFCWITKGKEIENYISVKSIIKKYPSFPDVQCGEYESFPIYIEIKEKNFRNDKVGFAKELKEFIDENDCNILDLTKQIKKLYEEIEKWNSGIII